MLKNFRDLFALLVAVFVFPLMWIVQGLGYLNIPEGVIGASIAIETLIAQFYFRKKEGESSGNGTPPSQ